MTEKKSNFLPLLLIGGGLAGAALLYGFGTKKVEEDTSFFGGVGTGGSGDFFGSSGTGGGTGITGGGTNAPTVVPLPFYNASDVVKGYDSTDLGIEDYAYNRANPDAYTNPSEGGANPENVYDDSGEWTFADTAVLGITAAAAAPAVAKGVKSVGSKVVNTAKTAGLKVVNSTTGKAATTTAGKAATTTAGKAATTTAGKAATTTAGKAASTAAKGAGVLGVLGLVDTFFEMTGVKDAHFSQTGLTGNLQGVNTSLTTSKSTVNTDNATKESVGNMAYDNRQLKIASGLAGTGSTYESITAEETKIVNEALGTSGDVIKQSYGSSGYSYIAAGGKQLSFAGTDLKTAASKATSTKKTVQGTTKSGTNKSGSSSSSGSAALASLSKLFGGK